MSEIKPQYMHSKFGQAMFDLCAKFTLFIKDKPWLFYLLSYTWGIILTAIGWVVAIIIGLFSMFSQTIWIKDYYWIFYITIGKSWGGLEFGNFFLIDCVEANSIKEHEFFHAVQNCLFGPFFIFMVWIPSWVRYWVRELFPKKKWAPYNSYWPEDAANQCGKYLVNYLKEKKNDK